MSAVLHGAGVGRGAAVGPVVRVYPAPHVAADAPVVRGLSLIHI